MKRLALLASAVALLVGCGGDDDAAAPEPEPPPPALASGRVYWLRDAKVWPVARRVDPADPAVLLEVLYEGPSRQERDELELETAVPAGGEAPQVSVADGVATVELPGELPDEALAQLVYTLTQLEAVEAVEVGGTSYTRADFEAQTPAILVESPLAFEEVGNPVRVSGTANTFEATFQYVLTDTDGLIVDEDFVTATSGSGERGTFELTTERYEIPFPGFGALIVFEVSAEDGSQINLVEIPLRMSG